jgi:hypothetical protein
MVGQRKMCCSTRKPARLRPMGMGDSALISWQGLSFSTVPGPSGQFPSRFRCGVMSAGEHLRSRDGSPWWPQGPSCGNRWRPSAVGEPSQITQDDVRSLPGHQGRPRYHTGAGWAGSQVRPHRYEHPRATGNGIVRTREKVRLLSTGLEPVRACQGGY